MPFSGNLPAAVDHAGVAMPAFTYTVANAPAGFALNPPTNNTTGAFTYTPPASFFGHPATFQYTVNEANVGTSTPYNIDLNVVANGFNIAPGQKLTETSQITGVGPLLISGGGTLLPNNSSVLNPNNYTGGTVVVNGSHVAVSLASQLSGDINLRDGSTIDVLQSMTLANKVTLG